MEDTATAEISRAQLWQWLRHGATLAEGGLVTQALYRRVRDERTGAIGRASTGRLGLAGQLLDDLVLDPQFTEFLTLKAYPYLD